MGMSETEGSCCLDASLPMLSCKSVPDPVCTLQEIRSLSAPRAAFSWCSSDCQPTSASCWWSIRMACFGCLSSFSELGLQAWLKLTKEGTQAVFSASRPTGLRGRNMKHAVDAGRGASSPDSSPLSQFSRC
ncbi:hypothetical protein MHYP_G00346040 [Metynnis hypsauchen]